MKLRPRSLITTILFTLSIFVSSSFIYLRRNLLFASTLLDKEAIFLSAGLTIAGLFTVYLLVRNLNSVWIKRTFYIYLAVFMTAICINEYLIYQTRRPTILLEASKTGFLNGMNLYLRDDGTYQVEQFELLSSKSSYGKYIIGMDSIYLNPSNRKKSLLHGVWVYNRDAQTGTLYIHPNGFLFRADDLKTGTDEPFLIQTDLIFSK